MTLSFSWATLANYSTGPDVGTPTRVDPASTTNGFIAGTIIAPQHINFLFDAVADQIIKALDAVDGGTYAPVAPIIFDDGEVQFIDTARLVITGPSGELSIEDAGTGFVDATSTLQIDGDLLIAGSGLVGPAGTLRIDDSERLTINDAANFFRLTLTPQSISLDSGTPTWVGQNFGAGWLQSIVTSGFSICFPLNLPVGDTISTVVVGVNGGFNGGHASLPAGTDRLAVELVQVSAGGAVTSLALRRDQAGSVGAYDAPHTVTLATGALDTGAMPQLVDDDFAYYVVIRGEQGANAIANTTLVTSISGECVARSYRSELMTY